MFNINNHDLKKSKKEYSHILKNTNANSYRLHEKMSSMLNHSIQSNISDTTASKSNTTKTLCSSNRRIAVNDKKPKVQRKIKCSYLDFLELRKTKNTCPFGSNEKRFKWQNLHDETILVCPEINKKPHRKQFLLKETFGEEAFGAKVNNVQPPRTGRIRRFNSGYFCPANNDFEISRRVVLPEWNKEKEIICKKKSFSQNDKIFHKTTGNIKSLFELTPYDIPIKGKKLYKNKSCFGLSINIFDDEYGKYEIPKHTKRHYFDNKCYYDNIKDQNLIFDMNKCWKVSKIKRSKSFDNQGFRTSVEFRCYQNIDNLHLRKSRNKENCYYNKTETNNSLSKIRRNNKKTRNNF